MTFAFTWFRKRESTRGLRIEFDREDLGAQLAGASAADEKDALPLVCFSTFRGDRRGNDRVEAIYMFGADIDEPQSDPAATMALISEALGGVEVFVYSTYSSEPTALRLRALVPYDVPATGEQHRASWALVARRLARAGIAIDRACCDPARGFYVWSVPPNGVYYSGHIDGAAWPVAYAAEAEQRRRAIIDAAKVAEARSAPRPTGDLVTRARKYLAKCDPAIAGSRGHDSTYGVALRLVRGFGLDVDTTFALLRAEFNPRCQPPWSDGDLRRKVEQAARAERVGEGWLASGGRR